MSEKKTEFKVGDRVYGLWMRGTITSVHDGMDFGVKVEWDVTPGIWGVKPDIASRFTTSGRLYRGSPKPAIKLLKKKKKLHPEFFVNIYDEQSDFAAHKTRKLAVSSAEKNIAKEIGVRYVRAKLQ